MLCAQRQVPFAQLPAQTTPQSPQFAASFLTFTQLSPQSSKPPEQPHVPSEQI